MPLCGRRITSANPQKNEISSTFSRLSGAQTFSSHFACLPIIVLNFRDYFKMFLALSLRVLIFSISKQFCHS